MTKIPSADNLQIAIKQLETELSTKRELLGGEFKLVIASLKPAKIIKSTLSEVVTAPYIMKGILTAVIGVGSGYLLKKIIVSTSSNIILKLLRSALQLGMKKGVSINPNTIISAGQFILEHFLRKKRKTIKKDNDE